MAELQRRLMLGGSLQQPCAQQRRQLQCSRAVATQEESVLEGAEPTVEEQAQMDRDAANIAAALSTVSNLAVCETSQGPFCGASALCPTWFPTSGQV